MRGLETGSDLKADRERVVEGQASAGKALEQGLSGYEFEYKSSGVVCFFEAIDGSDVRMIRARPRLALPSQAAAFGSHRRRRRPATP